MNENVKDAGNRSVTIHGEIRKYFLPVSKSYLHRLTFYLLYCAFLIIPATAKFLGQFRTGAAFMAIFLGIALAAPWSKYFKSLKEIAQRWPSQQMQDELYQSFAESESVFGGEARIGRRYTFLREEIAIIPTNEVKDILMFRIRAGMLIKAATASGDLKITQLPFNKDVLEDVKAQVSRAKECLTAMQAGEPD